MTKNTGSAKDTVLEINNWNSDMQINHMYPSDFTLFLGNDKWNVPAKEKTEIVLTTFKTVPCPHALPSIFTGPITHWKVKELLELDELIVFVIWGWYYPASAYGISSSIIYWTEITPNNNKLSGYAIDFGYGEMKYIPEIVNGKRVHFSFRLKSLTEGRSGATLNYEEWLYISEPQPQKKCYGVILS